MFDDGLQMYECSFSLHKFLKHDDKTECSWTSPHYKHDVFYIHFNMSVYYATSYVFS